MDSKHIAENMKRAMHGMSRKEVLNKQADCHGGAGHSFLMTESGMSHDNPMTMKGRKIMSSMKKQYGGKKAKQVFYASRNKGTIRGVD